MRPLLAAVLLLVSLGVRAQGVVLDGRRCATPEPTVAEALAAQRATRAYRAAGAFLRVAEEPITVPVAVHVLRAGPTVAEGDVPDAWIEAQMDTLNAAFADLGLRFALALVQRVDAPEWYEDLRLGSAAESAMKRELALDPARVMNLYTASPALDYLGWATLPEAGGEADDYQGVVILDQSMPGGDATPYDLGHTGTHEVGHWAGLAHTFSGGCSAPNDGVDDTPQERSGASGCPTTRDSCPADPGLDPVHNFMDYSDDACMTEFTPGQADRVRAMMGQYRPTLVAGGFALATVPRGALAETFVGVETVAPLRVTNATHAPLTVTGATADGAETSLSPVTLAPGEAARLDLVVRPTRRGAITVEITTDAAVPTDLLRLEGTATAPPTARLAQASLAGRVLEDAVVERTVTLANDGDGTLSFAVDAEALPAWVASVAPTSGTVAPGAEVALAVTLSSDALEPGTVSESIAIVTNDPLRPTVEVAVGLDVLRRPTALAAGLVFPNPSRGAVTVPLELPDAMAVWADVIDVRGRVVAVLAAGETLEAGYPELRWAAAGAAPGLYLVRVRTDGAVALARFTLTR